MISFEDVFTKNKKQSYLLIRSWGADGGAFWGRLIVAKYQHPYDIKVLREFKFGDEGNKAVYLKGAVTAGKNGPYVRLNRKVIADWHLKSERVVKDSIERHLISTIEKGLAEGK